MHFCSTSIPTFSEPALGHAKSFSDATSHYAPSEPCLASLVLSRKYCGHFSTKMINPEIKELLLVKKRMQIPKTVVPQLLKRDLFCGFRGGGRGMIK